MDEDWRGIQASGGESWTQAIGRGCYQAGFEALIVPSARNRSGRNIVIYLNNLLETSQVGNESKLELRDRLNMARSLFGRVVNVSERTIAKVEAETDTAEKLKRPYNEVYRLFEALSDVVEVESLGGWFQLPNDAFDGLKPIEVIERGEIDRLWNMAFRLQSGMPG